MQAVTTPCRFHCGVVVTCALLSAVALVVRRLLCAKVVGATSSEGFLVALHNWTIAMQYCVFKIFYGLL